MLFLLDWPDLGAAARLVMKHHDDMVGQSCKTFNQAARHLEDTAPWAAMLLYRRGAFCQFGGESGWVDSAPNLARCAELWARHPIGSYDSHEAFMDQLAQEKG